MPSRRHTLASTHQMADAFGAAAPPRRLSLHDASVEYDPMSASVCPSRRRPSYEHLQTHSAVSPLRSTPAEPSPSRHVGATGAGWGVDAQLQQAHYHHQSLVTSSLASVSSLLSNGASATGEPARPRRCRDQKTQARAQARAQMSLNASPNASHSFGLPARTDSARDDTASSHPEKVRLAMTRC